MVKTTKASEVMNPEIEILYEDADVAIVRKPSGIVVNKADTVKEPTLQEWWENQLREQGRGGEKTSAWESLVPDDFPHEYGSPMEVFAQRGGVVHRLDKETSGIMVLAKNPGALAALLRQFRVRDVEKKYICLVHGKFQILEDTLHLPLARAQHNRTQFAVDSTGRVAETRYKVVQSYKNVRPEDEKIVRAATQKSLKNWRKKILNTYQGFSLVECWPKTGRTHQIRVHMKHINHPIVADETYLGSKRLQLDLLWCPRLFLHAAELELTHPRSGETLHFTDTLPPDLEQALTCLEGV